MQSHLQCTGSANNNMAWVMQHGVGVPWRDREFHSTWRIVSLVVVVVLLVVFLNAARESVVRVLSGSSVKEGRQWSCGRCRLIGRRCSRPPRRPLLSRAASVASRGPAASTTWRGWSASVAWACVFRTRSLFTTTRNRPFVSTVKRCCMVSFVKASSVKVSICTCVVCTCTKRVVVKCTVVDGCEGNL